MDIDDAMWTLPAGRMKGNREHRVPLSKRALEIRADAAELSDCSDFVFSRMRSCRPLSEHTPAKMLRELGFDAVTHGFQSSFRDYAAEQMHTPHAVMEALWPTRSKTRPRPHAPAATCSTGVGRRCSLGRSI